MTTPQRTIRRILTLAALVLVSATLALAETPETSTWHYAEVLAASHHKLFVVTTANPTHRQTCHVQSITEDKLVCSRALGASRTYLPQQVVALILPGDSALQLRVFLGLNGALGAAIWGTVVLASTCPPCAVGTGIAALFFLGFAGAVAMTDDQPNRLLYLAPGQQLSSRLGYVQS